MNDNDQFREYLYETIIAMAASIKSGGSPYAYMLAMLCMGKAETDVQYTHPRTEWFREDILRYTAAAKIMKHGLPDDAWYARHMEDILSGSIRNALPLYYRFLFRGVSDAIQQLEQGQPEAARQTLIQAQQEAEQVYLDETAW